MGCIQGYIFAVIFAPTALTISKMRVASTLELGLPSLFELIARGMIRRVITMTEEEQKRVYEEAMFREKVLRAIEEVKSAEQSRWSRVKVLVGAILGSQIFVWIVTG